MLPPFAIQSEDIRAMARHCTVGIEPRISAERLILLDTQVVNVYGYMWLKADGFTDLLRGWWQGVEEANKNSALQQVEFWDGVERERSLSEGETELKKEAKDSFKRWVLLEETH
ncbi:hypothetical protein CK203_024434 [Vitis vinifera]|uniref:Uncharacterized protein n=1 Tax=Vitis vinifera TaxID=29760 RepID=A0A438IYJ1_VITVI|nr:hypothetical protein CK203_024434 [Vitis vinifera]